MDTNTLTAKTTFNFAHGSSLFDSPAERSKLKTPPVPTSSGSSQRVGEERKPKYFAGFRSAAATATKFISNTFASNNMNTLGKALYQRGIAGIIDDSLHLTIKTTKGALVGMGLGMLGGWAVSWYNPLLVTPISAVGATLGGVIGAYQGAKSAYNEVRPLYNTEPLIPHNSPESDMVWPSQ